MKDAIKNKITKLIEFDPNMLHLDFEIVKDPDEDYDPWFGTEGGDHSAYLYQFGTDGTGGIFALWDKIGIDNSDDPAVVFMGSEGETAVAAKNFDDFLCLLTGDYILYDLILDGEKTHYKELIDEDEFDDVGDEQAEYLKWLKEEYKLSTIKPIDEIIKEADTLNDDFFDWIDARIDESDLEDDMDDLD